METGSRRPLSFALLAALALFSAAATAAGQEDYAPQGDVAGTATVVHPRYRFDVVPPDPAYAEQGWMRFADRAAAGKTTVLVTGTEDDSYALSVKYHGESRDGDTPASVAHAMFAPQAFASIPNRDDCVLSALDAPHAFGPGMIGYTAVCVDPKAHEVYELSLSWQSLQLRLDELPKDAQSAFDDCDRATGKPPPHPGCKDTLAGLRTTMKTFVDSFRFTP
jgi:hypothetical protein